LFFRFGSTDEVEQGSSGEVIQPSDSERPVTAGLADLLTT